MEYKIVDKPPFRLIGKPLRVSMKDGENFTSIPAFWNASGNDGTVKGLVDLTSSNSVTGPYILGVCTDFRHDMQEFTYLIAAESITSSIPEGYIAKALPAATWAVFESVGKLPESIQAVWKRIFSEFFPLSGYQHAPVDAEIEVYPHGDVSVDDYRCQVWIPVLKKT